MASSIIFVLSVCTGSGTQVKENFPGRISSELILRSSLRNLLFTAASASHVHLLSDRTRGRTHTYSTHWCKEYLEKRGTAHLSVKPTLDSEIGAVLC